MSVLLGGLRTAGIVLLALLALAAVVSLLPAGVRIAWRQGGQAELWLTVGPLRRRFLPPREEPPSPPGGTAGGKKPAAGTGDGKAQAAPQADRAPAGDGEKKPPAAEPPAAPPPADEADRLAQKLMDDPLHYVRLLQRWARGPGRFLLRRLKVRHVRIVWTVHCGDAAATAVTYGALMAACNTAWAALQDLADIRADELRIEPDFTGERAGARCFACQITARLVIIGAAIWLTVQAGAKRRAARQQPRERVRPRDAIRPAAPQNKGGT